MTIISFCIWMRPAESTAKPDIYQQLQQIGFKPIASFKTATPLFGADLFHTVNPELVIFKRNHQNNYQELPRK